MTYKHAEALSGLYRGVSLDSAMTIAQSVLNPLGFDVACYDFSPVPLTHDGQFILPTVYDMRNTPDDMIELWCDGRYYYHDPVMDAARQTTRPFIWSYGGRHSSVMEQVLDDKHRPVVDYLCDTGLRNGITVPIRNAVGGLATFTAISTMALDDQDLEDALIEVGHLAHILHDAVVDGFSAEAFQTPHVRLSSQERRCLRLCSHGLTAKQIADEIGRSVATVTFHLTVATRKLGARNRFQALALAAHYHLLDS